MTETTTTDVTTGMTETTVEATTGTVTTEVTTGTTETTTGSETMSQ
jgi:hypothetical protein